MDIDKTIQFLIEQQAQFEARFGSFQTSLQGIKDAMVDFNKGMAEVRRNQQDTERLINAFAKAGQAQIELHSARLDSVERRMEADEQRFRAFLSRFDAFLRGQKGNGHAG